MKVVHIATRDTVGGASIAAYRLHQGLRSRGISSTMLVDWKASADDEVVRVRRNWSRAAMLRRRFVDWRVRSDFRRYRETVSSTLELLTDDRHPGGRDVAASLPDADVYNLHWVSGFIDYRTFFGALPPGKPVVWTLHDMNPFTGGCHYTLGCRRFEQGCGACPQLGSNNRSDLTAGIHARKSAAFKTLRPDTTRFVATSRWMQQEARASSLVQPFSVSHVPYGLNTDTFRPRDRDIAREVFGLPSTGKVVLFAAESLGNHRKGFDLLAEALAGLMTAGTTVLVSIGEAAAGSSAPHIALGTLKSERLLSFAYSLADVFVMPARQEAFGQVVFEAMSCGVPVVGFDVGGIPDLVRSGETGLLAPPEDVAGLRTAIEAVLNDDDLRARLSANCRRIAVQEYSLEIQAKRYVALYSELVEAERRVRGGADRPFSLG